MSRTSGRRLAAVIALVALAPVIVSCAAAPPEPSIGVPEIHCESAAAQVSPATASPGTDVTVSGEGWLPCVENPEAVPVTIEWIGQDGSVVITDTVEGTFAASVTVPSRSATGTVTIRVSTATNVPVELDFTVTD